MKEENLNNKKQEWVTPKISQMGVEDTQGKPYHVSEPGSFGPS